MAKIPMTNGGACPKQSAPAVCVVGCGSYAQGLCSLAVRQGACFSIASVSTCQTSQSRSANPTGGRQKLTKAFLPLPLQLVMASHRLPEGERILLPGLEDVPVVPLREAVAASGMSLFAMCS
jgi:hypothetical protein